MTLVSHYLIIDVKNDVRKSAEYSRNVVYEVMKMCSKLGDVDYREAIDRLKALMMTFHLSGIVNATCFSQVKRKSIVCRRSALTMTQQEHFENFENYTLIPNIKSTQEVFREA